MGSEGCQAKSREEIIRLFIGRSIGTNVTKISSFTARGRACNATAIDLKVNVPPALQEFVPKVILVSAKNFLICHSEADTSVACKKDRCICLGMTN